LFVVGVASGAVIVQKEEAKRDHPLMRLPVTDLSAVTRVVGKSGTHGFQVGNGLFLTLEMS